MPAGSIMNGCTGNLRPVQQEDFLVWSAIVREGSEKNILPFEIASQTAGRHLHCVELWMPGGCNLSCRHCYVATHPNNQQILSDSEFYHLTYQLVKDGFVDVVVPGMEPLLRSELWEVFAAAAAAGARSVGLTTNGILLAQYAKQLHESSLTVLNVSLDGPPGIHDNIRGKGVFKKLERGVRAFREISKKRLLTNTTVHAENAHCLTEIAAWGLQYGVDYAAFHPFELAEEAENALAISPHQALSAYQQLIHDFRAGKTSSVVLEAEASTFWVVIDLLRSGVLDQAELVIDEAGFLFFRESLEQRELLVGLNFYPHHFIRTIRIASDGGLSSCRSMARTGWQGIGDVRCTPARELVVSHAALAALALIWTEFRQALSCLDKDSISWMISFVGERISNDQSLIRHNNHRRTYSKVLPCN